MNVVDLYFAKHALHAVVELVTKEVERQGTESYSFDKYVEVLEGELNKMKEGHRASVAAAETTAREKEMREYINATAITATEKKGKK